MFTRVKRMKLFSKNLLPDSTRTIFLLPLGTVSGVKNRFGAEQFLRLVGIPKAPLHTKGFSAKRSLLFHGPWHSSE